eukprot:TRINITY_DN441_c0_g1_i3.p1 TRINITY_DN441_c0_g1~~TRINITY_DN441_c0_g1_i3.p1  ORF type:complete len:563 (+),score=135.38 TRINITY_DN441_c0_g1_i3:114-1802(+)
MTRKKRRSLLSDEDETNEKSESDDDDDDDNDSDEEVIFVNKNHPNNRHATEDAEPEENEDEDEHLKITKRTLKKEAVNSSTPPLRGLSSSSIASSASSSSAGLAEILSLHSKVETPSRKGQIVKSPPSSPSRRVNLKSNSSPRKTPPRPAKTATIIHRRPHDSRFDSSQLEISTTRARLWLEPSTEQQSLDIQPFEKERKLTKKKTFMDSDDSEDSETATNESDESDEERVPFNFLPEIFPQRNEKTLFEELEFEDEYARWEHENEIEEIQRETELKETEREAKELADWEEMKKKQIEFHLARIQSDMKKLATHFKEDDLLKRRVVAFKPDIASEKVEHPITVEDNEQVEDDEKSKQSPLSSTDDNFDTDRSPNRPWSSTSSSELNQASNSTSPYLVPPTVHSLSLPSLLLPATKRISEIEKRYSTLDLSTNNSHLMDVPLSPEFSQPEVVKTDSPSMGFGIEAATRFTSIDSAEASSRIANHVESNLFNMVELMHKEFSSFPSKIQKINDRLEAKSLQLAERREKALQLLFKPKHEKEKVDEEDDDQEDDRDYLSFSEEED